jgi:hypothetical protein
MIEMSRKMILKIRIMATTLQCQPKTDPVLLPYPSWHSLPISHFDSRKSRTCESESLELCMGMYLITPTLTLPLKGEGWVGVIDVEKKLDFLRHYVKVLDGFKESFPEISTKHTMNQIHIILGGMR